MVELRLGWGFDNLDLLVADYSLLYALETRQKSYGPILN